MTPALEEALRMLRLADSDLAAFKVLHASPDVAPAMAGFHAHQPIEKCLKAVLFAQGISLRRTHDLIELADLLGDSNSGLPLNLDQFALLNPYAVTLRYDDLEVQTLSAEEAGDQARQTESGPGWWSMPSLH